MTTPLRPIAVAADAVVACASPPAPLHVARESGVRIQSVDEDGDEWLHEHCEYHGTAVVYDRGTAISTAEANRSNFVELLYRSIETSTRTDDTGTTTSRSGRHIVVLFACSENPPW